MKTAVAALDFLTIAGRARSGRAPADRVGDAAPLFPVVGLLLGFGLILVDRTLQGYLDSEVLSVIVVGFLTLMTGGIHLNGLRDTLDRVGAPDAARDRSCAGLLGVVLLLLLKIRTIEVAGGTRAADLLLAPMLARWALVVFLYRTGSQSERYAASISARIASWHLFVTTGAVVAFAAFLSGRASLWVALTLSLWVLIGRACLQRRTGGISIAHCGAVVESGEALALVLFSAA